MSHERCTNAGKHLNELKKNNSILFVEYLKSLRPLGPLFVAFILCISSCTTVKETDQVTAQVHDIHMPVLTRKENNKVLKLSLQLHDSTASKTLTGVHLDVLGDLSVSYIKNISIYSDTTETVDFNYAALFGKVSD